MYSCSSDPTTCIKPKDTKDGFAILYFLLIGAAAGLGWTATINSFDYFDKMFPEYNITFIFPLAVTTSHVILTFVITQLSNILSFNARIIGSYVVTIILTGFQPLQAFMYQKTEFGMYMIMAILFISGFCANVAYASIAGFTSQLEGKYTAYFLIGVALFGLIANFIKDIILIIFPLAEDDDIGPIMLYFGIIVIIMIIAVCLHIAFMRSEFYSIYAEKATTPKASFQNLEESLVQRAPCRPKRNLKTLLQVFSETKLYIGLMFIGYLQHNATYPGLMLKKTIDGMANHTKTVSMILTFSFFYIFGKKSGQYRNCYNKYTAIIVTIIRFAFVAAFIIQACTNEILILNTAWFGYLNIALSAITLGFLNVSLFVMAPEQVIQEKKEVVGFANVISMNFGTILGTLISLRLKDLDPNVLPQGVAMF